MRNKPIKIIFILLNLTIGIFFTNFCYANQHLPANNAIPGGIAVLPLDLKTIQAPVVYFNGKQVLVVKYHSPIEQQLNWMAIVGIPITTKPGIQKISIHANPTTYNTFKINLEKTFLVSKKLYPQEVLKIDPNLVYPSSPTDQLRIKKETESIKQAYRYWSQLVPNLKLHQPVLGRKSSVFGLNRILNGKKKGYHSGLDLAAPIGTPIYAAAAGQVILTGNFFYTGNTIFIDHGQSLITSYFHLHTIDVAEGDTIAANSAIGTVGATGRVTGPHLHWSVSLNDARINPELFLY
jgi:murein DD-endopeptidase MepM/ murein hydrolase activator NlpD